MLDQRTVYNELATRFNPFQEDPLLGERMHEWVISIKAKGEASGRSNLEAKAEGELDAIRRLHQSEILDTPKAITAIHTFIAEGIIPEGMAEPLIRQLEQS